nr:hypothetical protein [Tanacetum cinerariifolium]
MASVSNTISKLISIPDEEFSDDTFPGVARKFLNEIKDTIVTLQRVVKHRMNGNVKNFSSPIHQEIHKIFNDEIIPILNQVDARVQNFKNHFLKEVAKFVQDFKSLAKEADSSLDKITVLEKENKHLLRAVFSQDIMSIVQIPSIVETFELQTELERTKESLENCIIKKENECAKLWNDCMNSSKKNQSDNVLESENQKKHKPNVKKSKKLGSKERLALPRPRKPRTFLRWLRIGRIFDLSETITESSNTESESDTSVRDNASASNPQKPTSKGFPNSTYFLNMFQRLRRQNMYLYPLAAL